MSLRDMPGIRWKGDAEEAFLGPVERRAHSPEEVARHRKSPSAQPLTQLLRHSRVARNELCERRLSGPGLAARSVDVVLLLQPLGEPEPLALKRRVFEDPVGRCHQRSGITIREDPSRSVLVRDGHSILVVYHVHEEERLQDRMLSPNGWVLSMRLSGPPQR